MFADPVVSVFPTELRDGGDGLGAVHGHSAAGEFIRACCSVRHSEASGHQDLRLSSLN